MSSKHIPVINEISKAYANNFVDLTHILSFTIIVLCLKNSIFRKLTLLLSSGNITR
jgi:hypothetical protein